MSEEFPYQLAFIRTDVTQKHITLALSIVGGMLGLDQAYKGRPGLALIKAITLGGLFLWYIVDVLSSAKTAGSAMKNYKEYLKQRNQRTITD